MVIGSVGCVFVTVPAPVFNALGGSSRTEQANYAKMCFLSAVQGAEIIGKSGKNPYVAILMVRESWLLRLIKYAELHYSTESNTNLLGSLEAGPEAFP